MYSCLHLVKSIDAKVRVSKIKELRAKIHKVINIIVEITKMNSKGKVKMIARCYYHQGRSAYNRLHKRKGCWKMVQRRWHRRSLRTKRVYNSVPQDQEEGMKRARLSGLLSGRKPDASYDQMEGTGKENLKDKRN